MSWDKIQGDWQRHVGQVRVLWGKISDDELSQINGNREKLVSKIMEKYKIPQVVAEEQVKGYEDRA